MCQHAVDAGPYAQPGFTFVAMPPENSVGSRPPLAVVMLQPPLQNAAYDAGPCVSTWVAAMSGAGQLGVGAVRHSPMLSTCAAVASRLNTRTQLLVLTEVACVVSQIWAAP